MWELIKAYIHKKYKVSPEFPWQSSPDAAVFRHGDNRKWFALVMDVKASSLGMWGEELITVINLKIGDPMLRSILFEQGGVLPAYHMNKQHWITARLDGSVDLERVCDLIDMSYLATASAKKKEKLRPAKEWIVPANPKYYDIEHAFDGAEEINWKQGAGIRTGDTVFIYVAAPVSAILYQCLVRETDIPYHYEDGKLTITALMKIRLVKRFPAEAFTFERLNKEYNIFAVRGPRGVPHSLSHSLKKEGTA